MSTRDDSRYYGREQSLIKHVILDEYLKRFAIIVGKRWDIISYVDGFSGPWNAVSDDLADASFAIALKQLRSARSIVAEKFNRDLRIRCLFLEKDKQAFLKLQRFAKTEITAEDAMVLALNEDFELAIQHIYRFIQEGGPKSFPFIFIDPTGWTGFSMALISPLLRLQNCEVLINFMTSFILRFIELENLGLESGFEKLFGDKAYRSRFAGLTGAEREDALVFSYADRVSQVGKFPYVLVTVVPHPTKDRAHFHLVYATRHIRGIQVFKDAERSAHKTGILVRANAKQREREKRTGQSELFDGELFPATDYYNVLAERYAGQARKAVIDLIRTRGNVPYNEVYGLAMRFPLVTDADLRKWIAEVATVEGLGPKERSPKPDKDHVVKLRKNGDV